MIYSDIGCACAAMHTMPDGSFDDIGFGKSLRKKLKRAVQPKRIVRRMVKAPVKAFKLATKPHKLVLRAFGKRGRHAAENLDQFADNAGNVAVNAGAAVADTFTGGAVSTILRASGMGPPEAELDIEQPRSNLPLIAAIGGGLALLLLLRR